VVRRRYFFIFIYRFLPILDAKKKRKTRKKKKEAASAHSYIFNL
jgi:hypothetical protein